MADPQAAEEHTLADESQGHGKAGESKDED